MVIIYINFVELELIMFHVNGGHLSHLTWTIYINFLSLSPRGLHMKFDFDWSSGFRREDV